MSSTISTYLGYRLYANNLSQSLQNEASEPTNATASAYYNANIDKVTSIDQFVGNYKLFNYAMSAYGLADMAYGTAFMKKVLESNLSDTHSFANSLTDPRYAAFAKAFQFTNGNVASTAQLQTSAQKNDIEARFAANSTEAATDQATDTTYYEKNIGAVKSVGDLEKDPTLYKYVLTAYGIDANTPQATVTQALESDLSNESSVANAPDNTADKAMASDFNFAADGSVSSPRLLQSAAALNAAVTSYSTFVGIDTTKAAATTDTTAQAAEKTATSYYQTTMPTITSLDQFLTDPQLTSYAIKAYGLPSDTTTAQLKSALTSDPNNLKGAATQLGSAFVTFAAAFNVSTSGTITQTPTSQPQTKAQLVATNTGYLNQAMQTEAGTNEGTGVQLALYFRQLAPTLTNAYQILADPALTQVMQTALGLNSSTSNADIDTQANYITSKVKLSDFQNPQKLDQFIDRFSVLYDIQNNSASANPVLQLFNGSPS